MACAVSLSISYNYIHQMSKHILRLFSPSGFYWNIATTFGYGSISIGTS